MCMYNDSTIKLHVCILTKDVDYDTCSLVLNGFFLTFNI